MKSWGFAKKVLNTIPLVISALLTTSCAFGDNRQYKDDIIRDCAGRNTTMREVERELQSAGVPQERLTLKHYDETLHRFYTRCGGLVFTCKGELGLNVVHTLLQEKKYGGTLDSSKETISEFNKIACPERRK